MYNPTRLFPLFYFNVNNFPMFVGQYLKAVLIFNGSIVRKNGIVTPKKAKYLLAHHQIVLSYNIGLFLTALLVIIAFSIACFFLGNIALFLKCRKIFKLSMTTNFAITML